MKCIKCQSEQLKVVDSRPVYATNQVRRRRVCQVCGFRMLTLETRVDPDTETKAINQKILAARKVLVDAITDLGRVMGGWRAGV